MASVSVIVPVYNVKEYLDECIRSILSQTYSDFELILVDDGSTDASGNICDEYAKIDSRIIVIHKENGGVSSARNIALDYIFCISTNKYITFIDSDDIVSLNYLETLINYMISADVACCGCIKFTTEVLSFKNVHKTLQLDNQSYWLLRHEGYPTQGIVTCKLFNKSLFYDLRFFENVKFEEDERIISRIIQKSASICSISDILYFYRTNGYSLTRTSKFEKEERTSIFLEMLLDRIGFAIDVDNGTLFNVAVVQYLDSIEKSNVRVIKQFKKRFKELIYIRSKSIKVNKTTKARLVLFAICPKLDKALTLFYRRIKHQ